MGDTVSKSWFCVFNNPADHDYIGTPEEVVDRIIEEWIKDHPQRSCAVAYCISKEGLHHLHAVFEDTKAMRFSAIKKTFPKMHIEETKGNKEQAEDYIYKRGKFEDKDEKIIHLGKYGDIKGRQGARRDLGIIEDLLQQGKTPNEIFDTSMTFRRYDKMIKEAYFRKRFIETPLERNIIVHWHVGNSGSGKSYTLIKLSETVGEENIYTVTDYQNGFDKYNGEAVLFLDEFRGQMRYNTLLTILDKYKVQVPCRYNNAYALWVEVHITSVFPPEKLYHEMVDKNKDIDTLSQLMRRIHFIHYHYKDGTDYKVKAIPITKYTTYEDLEASVQPDWIQECYAWEKGESQL